MREPSRVAISDRYEILGTLGEGGMGTVYCVLDKTLDKKFAMKVLRKELASDREIARRFEREVTAAKALNHPNLVSVYAHGINPDGSPFLIMDFIDGETLSARIQRLGELPPNEAMEIFIQVADAIAHAHENGILHRDLKPSNIMIASSDSGHPLVKVVDLGIAKVLPTSGRDTLNLTRTGEIFGSPLYMSPEQCKGEVVDARCDIYSMGCVMYETLVGHPPFEDANPVKIILAHMYEEVPKIRSNLVSESLQAVVMACLQKDPEDRYYESMTMLGKDLETVKSGARPNVELHAGKKRSRASLRQRLNVALPVLAVILCFAAIFKNDFFQAFEIMTGSAVQRGHTLTALDHNKPFILLNEAAQLLVAREDKKAAEAIASAMTIFEQRKDYPHMVFALQMFVDSASTPEFSIAQITEKLERAHSAQVTTPSKGIGVFGIYAPPLIRRQNVGSSILHIASTYNKSGKYKEAETLFELALVWGERYRDKYPWLMSEACLEYSKYLAAKHEDAKSTHMLKLAFEEGVKCLAPKSSIFKHADLNETQASTLFSIGREYFRRGDLTTARRAFTEDKSQDALSCMEALTKGKSAFGRYLDDRSHSISGLSNTADLLCDDINFKTIQGMYKPLTDMSEERAPLRENDAWGYNRFDDFARCCAQYTRYLYLSGHPEKTHEYQTKFLDVVTKRHFTHSLERFSYNMAEDLLLENNVAQAKAIIEAFKSEHEAQALKDSNDRLMREYDAAWIKGDKRYLDLFSVAECNYSESVKVVPNNVMLLASKQFAERRYLEAASLLEKSLRSATSKNYTKRKLAQCLFKAGKLDEAIDVITQVTNSRDHRITLARAYMEYAEMLHSKGDEKAYVQAVATSKNLMLTITRPEVTEYINRNHEAWAGCFDLAEYQKTKELYKLLTY